MTDDASTPALLRSEPATFEALRDQTAESLGVDPGLVEKDYWATEVLRVAVSSAADAVPVFKGGTSLSKAYRIIERFSEDIDLLIVTDATGKPLKRLLRGIADAVGSSLELSCNHDAEGRGYLNARLAYPTGVPVGYLTSGVLLEMGSRGGPDPNAPRAVAPLMADVAERTQPGSAGEFADLASFTVTVLAPTRTLAEKLAFLHHRATAGDSESLEKGARHLYDVAMLLRDAETSGTLANGQIEALMGDIDERSANAGWGFTPRPSDGFAASPAFSLTGETEAALRRGYEAVRQLVWGEFPSYESAIDTVRASRHLL